MKFLAGKITKILAVLAVITAVISISVSIAGGTPVLEAITESPIILGGTAFCVIMAFFTRDKKEDKE